MVWNMEPLFAIIRHIPLKGYSIMLDSQNNGLVTRVAERFRAMGDENRIRILSLLTQGPANVTALTR